MNLKCMIQILMLISTHPCQLITALYSLVPSRQKGKFSIYHASTLVHWFQVHVYYTCTRRLHCRGRSKETLFAGYRYTYQQGNKPSITFLCRLHLLPEHSPRLFFSRTQMFKTITFSPASVLFLKYLLTNMYNVFILVKIKVKDMQFIKRRSYKTI